MNNPSPKFLVFVEADANHNKFYRMIPQGSTFKVEYGRVGCNKIREDEYDIDEFWKKYSSKIKKGYQDQTELVKELIVEKKDGGHGFATIANASISEIVDRLQKYAKKCVAENYTVKAEQVTKAMVDKAQQILNELSDPDMGRRSVQWFNERLEELFRTIPRKMAHVKDFLAESSSDYNKIIVREQDTLDTMAGQVSTNAAATNEATDEGQPKTVLEKLGLKIEDATDDEVMHIKNHLGRDIAAKFKKAWRVTNVKTQAKYDAFIKANNITNKKMYYHGSRNENWWSILQSGLILRPTNVVVTGAMWGAPAIYFANKARKSYGYTSGRGSYWARGNSSTAFMAVFDVAEGDAWHVKHHSSEYYKYNWKVFSKAHPGHDSLFAEGGADLVNDEIIIYRDEQCTIHFLIELEG